MHDRRRRESDRRKLLAVNKYAVCREYFSSGQYSARALRFFDRIVTEISPRRAYARRASAFASPIFFFSFSPLLRFYPARLAVDESCARAIRIRANRIRFATASSPWRRTAKRITALTENRRAYD